MNKASYISLAILTNWIWGLAFFVPYAIPDINPVAIAFGRYIGYGLVALIAISFRSRMFKQLTSHDWLIASWFAVCGNVGYYILLSLAIHYSGITLSALIIGILPVTIMTVGNLIEKRIEFKNLIIPYIAIFSGLSIIHGYKVEASLPAQAEQVAIGFMLALIALLSWTWYGVHNALYLKKRTTVSSHTWALAIGLCASIQAVLGFIFYFGVFDEPFILSGSGDVSQVLIQFLLGSLLLGVVVSWLATLLWNIASRNLPTVLIGQLIVFETISSIAYEHLWDLDYPVAIELISIALIIFGVIVGTRAMNRQPVGREKLETDTACNNQ
jgi:drug/metabolite transporter (DMT)-like permease